MQSLFVPLRDSEYDPTPIITSRDVVAIEMIPDPQYPARGTVLEGPISREVLWALFRLMAAQERCGGGLWPPPGVQPVSAEVVNDGTLVRVQLGE